MIPEYLNLLTPVVSIIASYFYIKSVIKGDTVPNKVGWFIWLLAPLVSSFIILQNGGGFSAIPVFMSWIIPLIVLIASHRIKTKLKINKLDIICFVSAIIAMYFWLIAKNIYTATVFAIIADGFGFIPTIYKTIKHPGTEKTWPYVAGIFNAAISIFTLHNFSFHLFAFPFYLLIGNFILISVIILTNFKKNKDNVNSIKQIFAREGFANVYEWYDAPNTQYDEHAHKGKVSLYIVSGSVSFSGGINITLYKGERFDVPVSINHSATVGKNGCRYIVAEEIKGDS